LDWFGFFTPTEYDWIRKSQIDWFLQESGKHQAGNYHNSYLVLISPLVASIKEIARPFRPDSGKDLGSVWGRQDDQIIPGIRKLAKPNALMFFHIPLYGFTFLFIKCNNNLTNSPRPESYSKADRDSATGKALDVGISGQEPPGHAKKSDGFFENGVLKATESSHVSSNVPEVKVIGNGHCHSKSCQRFALPF